MKKKDWPYVYPSGRAVGRDIRDAYMKEVKKVREMSK